MKKYLIMAGCAVLTYLVGVMSGLKMQPERYEIRTHFRRSDTGERVRMGKLDGESLQFRLKEAEKEICKGFFGKSYGWIRNDVDLIIEQEVVEVE